LLAVAVLHFLQVSFIFAVAVVRFRAHLLD